MTTSERASMPTPEERRRLQPVDEYPGRWDDRRAVAERMIAQDDPADGDYR